MLVTQHRLQASLEVIPFGQIAKLVVKVRPHLRPFREDHIGMRREHQPHVGLSRTAETSNEDGAAAWGVMTTWNGQVHMFLVFAVEFIR